MKYYATDHIKTSIGSKFLPLNQKRPSILLHTYIIKSSSNISIENENIPDNLLYSFGNWFGS